MQEQIDRESIAITLKASRLTAKVLAKAFMAVVRKIQKEHQKAQTPHGKQSVNKLMNHNVPTNTIPIEGDKGLFEKVARKWNVDYASELYKTLYTARCTDGNIIHKYASALNIMDRIILRLNEIFKVIAGLFDCGFPVLGEK